jgi:hypothetical protein
MTRFTIVLEPNCPDEGYIRMLKEAGQEIPKEVIPVEIEKIEVD